MFDTPLAPYLLGYALELLFGALGRTFWVGRSYFPLTHLLAVTSPRVMRHVFRRSTPQTSLGAHLSSKEGKY